MISITLYCGIIKIPQEQSLCRQLDFEGERERERGREKKREERAMADETTINDLLRRLLLKFGTLGPQGQWGA